MALIARGWTNRQIADELAIAERTAETHARNIREKVGLTTRAELVAWANRRDNVAGRRLTSSTPSATRRQPVLGLYGAPCRLCGLAVRAGPHDGRYRPLVAWKHTRSVAISMRGGRRW